MTCERCAACEYSFFADVGEEGVMHRACQYILRRGTRRPCPPGPDCTAFEPRKRAERRVCILPGGYAPDSRERRGA